MAIAALVTRQSVPVSPAASGEDWSRARGMVPGVPRPQNLNATLDSVFHEELDEIVELALLFYRPILSHLSMATFRDKGGPTRTSSRTRWERGWGDVGTAARREQTGENPNG